jgi:tetratricopeptide (TPR) repeat protein
VPALPVSRERDALEIELLSSLGLALISTRGYSSAEVEEVYSRARQLCERYGDVPLRVLFGVWAVHFVRADPRGTKRVAALFERVTETSADRDALLVTHSSLGSFAFYRMDFVAAKRHLHAATALIDRDGMRAQHDRLLVSYGFEAILSGPVWLSWTEGMLGNEPEARSHLQEANSLAEEIGEPYLVCQVAAYSAALSRELRDVAAARRWSTRTLSLSADHELYFWRALGLCARGWVSLEDGQPGDAVAMIVEGLAILDAIGSVVNRSYFASYLVEAYLRLGRFEEGLSVVDEALAVCRGSLGPMYESELLRLKGVLLVEAGSTDQAIEHLRAALAEGRLRGAGLLELRAARTLGGLLATDNRMREAREILQASCLKWPSGSSGHEIAKARAALESLA